MDRGHKEIAPAAGQVLATGGLDLEAERPEQQEPRDYGQESHEEAGLRFGLSAEPGEPFLDAASRLSQRFG
jgi:hypothetical protein